MEKTTRIELEFESPYEYSATVTLVRKGKVETTTFELGKKDNHGGRRLPHHADLHFHFKGDRGQLRELWDFLALVLSDSEKELLDPEVAKRDARLQEMEKASQERDIQFAKELSKP